MIVVAGKQTHRAGKRHALPTAISTFQGVGEWPRCCFCLHEIVTCIERFNMTAFHTAYTSDDVEVLALPGGRYRAESPCGPGGPAGSWSCNAWVTALCTAVLMSWRLAGSPQADLEPDHQEALCIVNRRLRRGLGYSSRAAWWACCGNAWLLLLSSNWSANWGGTYRRSLQRLGLLLDETFKKLDSLAERSPVIAQSAGHDATDSSPNALYLPLALLSLVVIKGLDSFEAWVTRLRITPSAAGFSRSRWGWPSCRHDAAILQCPNVNQIRHHSVSLVHVRRCAYSQVEFQGRVGVSKAGTCVCL